MPGLFKLQFGSLQLALHLQKDVLQDTMYMDTVSVRKDHEPFHRGLMQKLLGDLPRIAITRAAAFILETIVPPNSSGVQ